MTLRLHLFIAGDGPNSHGALTNLRGLLARFPEREVELKIIDVIAEPELGAHAGVLITPMLVKVAPPPERRLLGNLKDHTALLAALGLDQGPT